MINFFLKNVQSIIIAIILVVIIEMLLPNGANKKYVKIVSGIYLIITILNPFFKIFNKDFDVDFENEFDSIETYNSNSIDLQNYYINSLKETMKLELVEEGYSIQSIDIILSSDYSEIIKITIKGALPQEQNLIKDYISKNYNVETEKILFM